MKIKSILASLAAVVLLAGCSKESTGTGGEGPQGGTGDIAYVSINIKTQPQSRASSETPGSGEESALQSLYFVTFDASGKVLAVPGTTNYFTAVTAAVSSTPEPFKVSASATKLLVVANPGTQLLAALGNLGSASYFNSFNGLIDAIEKAEIVDEGLPVTKGFAMIGSGVEDGKTTGDKITDPLVDIASNIHKVTETVTETEAKNAAAGDRVIVKIERLSAKISFKVRTLPPVDTRGAEFNFLNWTVDAVNEQMYPFAEKTLLGVSKTGTFYAYNFYTKDPNFSGTVGAGLRKATISTPTLAPVLPVPYTWMNDGGSAYTLENTMDAAYQQYGNATRVVVKGTYFPAGYTSGADWFNFAGLNYRSLDELQTAYQAVDAGPNFKAACDKFYDKVVAYLTANGKSVAGLTNFLSLTEAHLNDVSNGGEAVKDGTNDVIRWYQKGLCYYYNEVRHDNAATADNAFGKYGVVRNNWYSLTLAYVYGPGTPWYPDIDEPGPGDPDPKDPIDSGTGYLGVTVEVAPWILWENEIGF